MNATVGFITLNYLDKSVEMLIAYSAIAFGSIIVLTNLCLKRQYVEGVQLKHPSNDEIVTFAVLSLVFFVTLSQISKVSPLVYVASFALAWIVQKKIKTISEKPRRVLTLVLLPYLLLVTKALASTHYLPSIVILITLFTIFIWRCGAEAFAVAVLVFFSKYFYSGTFEVVDTFHSAEHFLASMGANKGYFSVFPNLGYFEEYPAFALPEILKFLSGGIVQMSIGTARFLIWAMLFLLIFSQIYSRNRLLTVLFMIAIPMDRLSLLIALAYAAFICASYDRALSSNQRLDNLSVFLLTLFPLFAIGLTPSYLLFPMLALIGMLPFESINRKQLIIIIIVWLMIIVVFYQQIVDYVVVYADLSKLYDIAYSTSITTLSRWDLGFWLILLFAATIVVSGIVRPSDSFYIKALKLSGALLILIKCADYGFGRIDPGFSRLVPMAIALMLVASFFSKRFNTIIAIMLSIIIVAYLQFELPRKLSKNDFSLNNSQDQPVLLSPPNIKIAQAIGEFADGRQVINYSNEPALAIGIPNVIVTPFTSPYVTIGELSQTAVISIMKANPKAIIYLGNSFKTFDDVDIRLRVPLVFRYLAQNYTYTNIKGNIYAVPITEVTSEISGKIFFDQLELKKSSLYYTNYGASRFSYREVVIDCTKQSAGRYKIINDNNTLLGDFQCGTNYVPEVFFLGRVKDIQREL